MNEIQQTNELFSPQHFYKSYKILNCASHWRHYTKGTNKTKAVKIPATLKLVYSHRLDQFNSFASQGNSYYETNQQVANSTGLSYRTVVEGVNPMLIKMGLMRVTKIGHNKYSYIMRPITDIQGELLNPALERPKDASKGIDRSDKEWRHYKANTVLIGELQDKIDKIKKSMFNDGVIVASEDKGYFSID